MLGLILSLIKIVKYFKDTRGRISVGDKTGNSRTKSKRTKTWIYSVTYIGKRTTICKLKSQKTIKLIPTIFVRTQKNIFIHA